MSVIAPLARSAVAATAAALLALGGSVEAHAAPAPSGTAWPDVAGAVDALVEDLVDDQDLPGVGLAVSKDDRLVVSRGYGYADTTAGTGFGHDMRTKLGSNTKPLVTGPAAWTAVTEAGLDPATLPLYGPGGVFGSAFDDDIEAGAAATGTPVAWYYDITVQHVLDHRGGFVRNASADAATDLFDVEAADLTYAQVHSALLRTQPLQSEPGTTRRYSNHGYGLLVPVVEELTGQVFRDYVDDVLLAPRGLTPEVQWTYGAVTAATARPHRRAGDGSAVPYVDVITNIVGLGAGGFRSSSRDAVELMVSLAGDHTDAELDAMGWGAGGLVDHDGRVNGGTSHVRMTGDGIAIALQTNISDPDAPLSSVAEQIIELVRDADVPAHYDLWTGCTLPAVAPGADQVARHGIASAAYRCTVDAMVGAGYRVERVDGFEVAGTVRFNALFVPAAGSGWRAFHGLTAGQYQALSADLVADGHRPEQVDSYRSGGDVRYAGVFVHGTGPRFAAYHGLGAEQHQERFDDLTAEGLRPTSLSVVTVDGSRRYTAVYEARRDDSYWVRSSLTPAGYQSALRAQAAAGRHPVALDGYTGPDGAPRIAAVFSSGPAGAFRARHGLTAAQYQVAWQQAVDDGFRTTAVTGYDSGGARYAAVWHTS